jgi:hypothetical protein
VMIHLHAFQNILTDSTTRFSDTTPVPEAKAGKSLRSVITGEGAFIDNFQFNVTLNVTILARMGLIGWMGAL